MANLLITIYAISLFAIIFFIIYEYVSNGEISKKMKLTLKVIEYKIVKTLFCVFLAVLMLPILSLLGVGLMEARLDAYIALFLMLMPFLAISIGYVLRILKVKNES
jgi:hypothetical protein